MTLIQFGLWSIPLVDVSLESFDDLGRFASARGSKDCVVLCMFFHGASPWLFYVVCKQRDTVHFIRFEPFDITRHVLIPVG